MDQQIDKDDWYLRLAEEFKLLEQLKQKLSKEDLEKLREHVYSYVEDKIENNIIHLNTHGPDWDKERNKIDTIIIHHTAYEKPITLSRLNTMHLLRLYVPFFQNPNEENKQIKGQAISSGHFMNKKQVFYGYHWFVKRDGSIDKLLEDKYIGWHAGNWDVNTKSIAICLDSNLENSSPQFTVTQSLANLINMNYPQIEIANILGHREVNDKTVCPGNEFLTGWKKNLIKLINNT